MKEQLQLSSALLIFFLFLHTHTHTPHTHSHTGTTVLCDGVYQWRRFDVSDSKSSQVWRRQSTLLLGRDCPRSPLPSQQRNHLPVSKSLLEFTEFYWQLTAAELCTSRQESTPVCGGLLGSLPTLTCWTREDPRWLLCLIGNQQGLTGGENFVATWHTYLFVSANSVFKHGHIVHTHREQEVVSHWCVATVLTLQNICLFFGVMCSIH